MHHLTTLLSVGTKSWHALNMAGPKSPNNLPATIQRVHNQFIDTILDIHNIITVRT